MEEWGKKEVQEVESLIAIVNGTERSEVVEIRLESVCRIEVSDFIRMGW